MRQRFKGNVPESISRPISPTSPHLTPHPFFPPLSCLLYIFCSRAVAACFSPELSILVCCSSELSVCDEVRQELAIAVDCSTSYQLLLYIR
ncbi:hypothetical protein CDD81_862 [Ophiocordyceps australis]|uniref:Uncharacterized protein n=1 Tax=Ophiocordyceps australis TaxID=1399860 RepID=A0A2C5YG12_9HYPO|nr:hypothetical protein CDD81_862 [Ophiocordyceps australis]